MDLVKGIRLDKLEKLANAIWQGEADKAFVNRWAEKAEKVCLDEDASVVKQFHQAQYVYFLIEGDVEHSLVLEGCRKSVDVGGVSLRFFPFGWSGFSPPYRYATSARTKTASIFYRWPIAQLNRLFSAHPQLGQQFFYYLLTTVLPLLDDVRSRLRRNIRSSDKLINELGTRVPEAQPCDWSQDDITELLHQSLFLEVFPEEFTNTLAQMAKAHHFRQGECLFKQGESSNQFMLLASGAVVASFRRRGNEDELFLRSYSSPGQVVASTVFSLSGRHEESVCAISDVTVLSVERAALQQLMADQPEIGLRMAERLLWLLSTRLRMLRTHLLAQDNEDEKVVVSTLLAQSSPQLGIASKLYKLPHLLSNRLTHEDAQACLEAVRLNGTRLERTIAGVCNELLSEVWREQAFYERLQHVYQLVTQAPLEQKHSETRRLCNWGFKQVFEHARCVVHGMERLPAQAGHIFVLNHLISHPYHALANGFEFALDTHFVSSMILEPKYGDGGVRVVRRGRGEEHGHHSYYDRLGHIYVRTLESDTVLETNEQAIARRERFNRKAGNYLANGINLIVCPEGTSRLGHESPTEFKKGIFHLAANLEHEPLIVPIAVAGFDKRLKDNAFAAVVHEPFYLSHRCNPHNKESLQHFLDQFQHTYRAYVLEAQLLADEVS